MQFIPRMCPLLRLQLPSTSRLFAVVALTQCREPRCSLHLVLYPLHVITLLVTIVQDAIIGTANGRPFYESSLGLQYDTLAVIMAIVCGYVLLVKEIVKAFLLFVALSSNKHVIPSWAGPGIFSPFLLRGFNRNTAKVTSRLWRSRFTITLDVVFQYIPQVVASCAAVYSIQGVTLDTELMIGSYFFYINIPLSILMTAISLGLCCASCCCDSGGTASPLLELVAGDSEDFAEQASLRCPEF